MKCKQSKETLFMGYIDGTISTGLMKELDRHISVCASCRDLKNSIDKGLLPLFRHVQPELPADEIWQGIRSGIASREQLSESKVFGTRHFWRKSIFAFAAAAALIFIVITFKAINTSQRLAVNNFLSQEGHFLYSLSSYNGDEDFNQTGFGTTIEEYFL
jgi:anti-sigma-K factor RskA